MTQAELKRAWKAYTDGCGSLNPERTITLDQFKERFAAFDAVIDPWITGEGSKESSVRKFAKSLGLKTWQGRAIFRAMFDVIDSIHPIT
jgi:hypothetical protein